MANTQTVSLGGKYAPVTRKRGRQGSEYDAIIMRAADAMPVRNAKTGELECKGAAQGCETAKQAASLLTAVRQRLYNLRRADGHDARLDGLRPFIAGDGLTVVVGNFGTDGAEN